MGIGINSTLIVDGMELELIPGKGRNGPLSGCGVETSPIFLSIQAIAAGVDGRNWNMVEEWSFL